MARSRIELHSVLVGLVGPDVPVYFQPDNDFRLSYPCVIYERSQANTRFANDNPYINTKRYSVTVVDRDPDSEIPDKIATMPLCMHSSFFVTDNLNHDVFDIYF